MTIVTNLTTINKANTISKPDNNYQNLTTINKPDNS